MTYDEWWDKYWADVPVEFADRTFGEEVWKAAQEALKQDRQSATPTVKADRDKG